MDEAPKCKVHGTTMIRKRDPRDGTLLEPPQWACGRCAADKLFGKNTENYVADNIKAGEEQNGSER
jgi:hypothetical protein